MERRMLAGAWGPIAGATILALVVAACGGPSPTGSPASPPATPGSTEVADASTAPTGSPGPSGSGPAPSAGVASGPPAADGPIATSGSIAAIRQDGALAIDQADGHSVAYTDPEHAGFGFPTWSPDGTRIALVRTSLDDNSIVVVDATAMEQGRPVKPLTIVRSTTIAPFYLYWTPDGRDVSFLASAGAALALRTAAADGSDMTGASGDGTVVRSGNPFYFDWIGRDRLIAHIGAGSTAFLGEIGLDGKPIGAGLPGPGTFRTPVVSPDGTSMAFVRGTAGQTGQVVVAARDGSDEHTMPVIGPGAVLFDPSGRTVGAIGATDASLAQPSIPVGPLRLMDVGSGTVRTVLDGAIVGFWWSPDGSTIAALRIQPTSGSPLAVTPVVSVVPAASAAPTTEVHLLFVDVAGGKLRSEVTVVPGSRFVDQLLTYFDQYALSHRIWAPDGASVLLPESDSAGTHLAVRYADGRPSRTLDGEIGFWTP